ncbi:MAG: FxsA family protein [Actinomycetota bacterium]|nr:FxsA family protein [Actinomycetota bacterium]
MPALLLLAFVVVPIVELFVIVQIGDLIGLVPTLVLLLVMSVAGAWLVRREGRAAWRNFTTALQQARIPAKEVVDGALVLVGGTLLLTPGFVTDAVGLLLVLPPTRAVANRLLRSRARGWLSLSSFGARRGGVRPPPRGRADEPIDVEVVDVQRNDGQRLPRRDRT